MKSTAAMLMIITIFSKIVGYGRDRLMAYYFGTGPVGGALVIAATIPTVLFGMIASGIATGFIPTYARIRTEQDEHAADRFTSNLVNLLFALTTAIVVLGLVFTKEIVYVFAPGFTVEREMTIFLTRFVIVTLYGTAWGSVFQGYLQIHGEFIAPALIGFLLNAFVILGMFLTSKTESLVFVGMGFLLGGILQYLIFIPSLKRSGYRHQMIFEPKDPNFSHLFAIGLPVILGVAVNDINILIDKSIASVISTAGVVSLNYGYKIFGFVTGIVVTSISTTVYPSLVESAEASDTTHMKKVFGEAIVGMSLCILPAMAGIALYSEDIVHLLFHGGEFGAEAVRDTATALFFYGLGLLGFGIRDIAGKSFYAMHEAKVPMQNAFWVVGVNITLNLILSQLMGIGGLAFASALSIMFGAWLMTKKLRERIGPLGLTRLMKNILRIACATAIMGGTGFFVRRYLGMHMSVNKAFFLTMIYSMLSYGAVILLMKIDGMDEFRQSLRQKLFLRGK